MFFFFMKKRSYSGSYIKKKNKKQNGQYLGETLRKKKTSY